MKKQDDFLVEILTEELPPKALLKLALAFKAQVKDRLEKKALAFDEIDYFATPRRLALLIKNLAAETPAQEVEKKGPALSSAFDASGKATRACEGFASSLGVTPDKLLKIESAQGSWVAYKQKIPGQSLLTLMPSIIEEALASLPIPKRMRWGSEEVQFVRPVHSVLMLYGEDVVPATLFGLKSGRVTRGHRFLAPGSMTIPTALSYASLLETEGRVQADFSKRRERIKAQAIAVLKEKVGEEAKVFISSENLLNEVTGLVEWPHALCGNFDEAFLKLPQEVLISSMEDHQRYFPVLDVNGKLLPHFITISNIIPHDPKRVIHGNERVLRARLADAAFFYENDSLESLESRIARLSGIVFQAKLGTLHDEVKRLSQLAPFIAEKIGADVKETERAAWLAKSDLTTGMVLEFPELQGIMGTYYAKREGEPEAVALALSEQYLPRFSGDELPKTGVGKALALAERIDSLVGAFGINQIPTGDKDPYGLRRKALGILRILIENEIDLDLKDILNFAQNCYAVPLENKKNQEQILTFLQERLRAWYLDQEIAPDIFAAVSALSLSNPLDVDKRIKAVQAFKKLNAAETLSSANKRVSNILTKYTDRLSAEVIDPAFFDNQAEKELAKQLESKSKEVAKLYQNKNYAEVLITLGELKKPIDDFFDQVMVMTEEKPKRENRILLLKKLRALFLQVADIALLQ